MEKSFVSTMRKGFRMTFANGVTASVQWGAGNYCDNGGLRDFTFSKDAESNTADVAAMNSNREFISREIDGQLFSSDDVAGYLTSEEVLDFLNKCRNYTGSTKKSSYFG